MKRFFLLTIVFAMLFSLSGCIIIPLHKNLVIPEDTVASIEVFDLRNDSRESSIFDTENPVYTIPPAQLGEFLDELGKLQLTDYIVIILAAVDPGFYYGSWVIRINYKDGSYEYLSESGYSEVFDENGKWQEVNTYAPDDEERYAFIQKFVPEELFNAVS